MGNAAVVITILFTFFFFLPPSRKLTREDYVKPLNPLVTYSRALYNINLSLLIYHQVTQQLLLYGFLKYTMNGSILYQSAPSSQ